MRKENIFLIVSVIVIIAAGIFFFKEGKIYIKKRKDQELQRIIDCLFKKKIKLYIISNCKECENQKEVFGDKKGDLQIIDCGNEKKFNEDCKEKKINSFPTWITDFKLSSIKSCFECRKENIDLRCNDFCYTETEDKKFYKIIGAMDLSKIKEVFECSNN